MLVYDKTDVRFFDTTNVIEFKNQNIYFEAIHTSYISKPTQSDLGLSKPMQLHPV